MWRVVLASVWMTGCIIRTSDPFGLGGHHSDFDVEDVDLEVNPSSVSIGETALLEVFDLNGLADFEEVYDVRSIGDFSIREYSVTSDVADLVVDVAADAQGEQVIAFDFEDGTAYATFRVF